MLCFRQFFLVAKSSIAGASLVVIAIGGSLVCSGTSSAQRYIARGGSPELMDSYTAEMLSMEQAWIKSVSLPNGMRTLADLAIYVDPNRPDRYTEIVVGADTESERVLSRLKLGTMGPEGRMLDDQESLRLATNDIRRLKRRKMEATSRIVESPSVTIYTIADDGTLESRDGETGDIKWRVAIGNRGLGYGELGVGADDLVVTNGSNLFHVSAVDGQIKEELRTNRQPVFGAIVTGKYAIINTVGGNVEIYDLSDVTLDPYIEHVQGSALTRPVQFPGSLRIAWPTDRGYVYVSELGGTPSTVFRADSDGLARGGVAAASGGRFFYGTDRGQAYGLDSAVNGTILWSESLGVPIADPPVVSGNRALFTSEFGELFCLDVVTGTRLWDAPVRGISKVYAAFEGKIYASSASGRFRVLNLEDGSVVNLGGNFDPSQVIRNVQTNRLYFVTSGGLLQCMRPSDSPLVKLIASPPPVPQVETEKPDVPEVAKPSDQPIKVEDDPFGTGAGDDPFGPGAGGDPFGPISGDDPFGSMGDDPFN